MNVEERKTNLFAQLLNSTDEFERVDAVIELSKYINDDLKIIDVFMQLIDDEEVMVQIVEALSNTRIDLTPYLAESCTSVQTVRRRNAVELLEYVPLSNTSLRLLLSALYDVSDDIRTTATVILRDIPHDIHLDETFIRQFHVNLYRESFESRYASLDALLRYDRESVEPIRIIRQDLTQNKGARQFVTLGYIQVLKFLSENTLKELYSTVAEIKENAGDLRMQQRALETLMMIEQAMNR